MKRDDAYARKFATIVESLAKVPDRTDDLSTLEREGVLHLVQVSVDAAMDLAAMTVKDAGREVKDDYHNLATLVELKLLGEAEAEELRRLNGLRNAIVHKYNTFEEREVFDNLDAIQRMLLDFVERVEEKG